MVCKMYVGQGEGYEMHIAVLGMPARDLLNRQWKDGLPTIVVFLDSAPEDQRQALMEELQQMANRKKFGCLPTMAAFASEGMDGDYDCGDQVFVMTSEYEGSLFKSVVELSQGKGCAIVLRIGADRKPLLMDLAHGTALEMRAI